MAGILGAILGAPERKAVGSSERWLEAFVTPSKSGVPVGVDGALKCTTALAATRLLSQGIAQPEFGLYQRSRSDPRKWDAVLDHPVAKLISRPNEWQTSFEFRETMMMHAVLAGGGVAFKNRGATRSGPVRELIPILPGSFTIQQMEDYSLKYFLTFANGRQVILDRSDVLHIRGMSWNTYEGLEAIQMAREAIGLALVAEETHARLHSNGARPGGILSAPANVDLDDDQIKAIRDAWSDAYGGVHNAQKTAILTGGLTWQQVAMKGVDSEHLDTRRFQIEEICRGMGIFPVMVGHSDKSSTFASANAFMQAHVNVSLLPWASRFEQACSRDLLSPDEQDGGLAFDIDLVTMLRGDPDARRAFYATCVPLGVLTRNEARVMEGLNPIDGLDEPLTPANALGAAQNSAMQPVADPTKALAAAIEQKIGRVISTANERRLAEALALISEVIQQVQQEPTE